MISTCSDGLLREKLVSLLKLKIGLLCDQVELVLKIKSTDVLKKKLVEEVSLLKAFCMNYNLTESRCAVELLYMECDRLLQKYKECK